MVDVSGYAESNDGDPLTNVHVGFQEYGCPGCRIYDATTDSTGDYELTLPAGDYVAGCKPTGLDAPCAPEVDGQTSAMHLDGDQAVVNFLVVVSLGGDSGSGGSGNDGSHNGGSDGPPLSGHVTDSTGRPVAGAEIELEVVGGMENVHVATDANGYYQFDDMPVDATAVCVAAEAANCDPRGIGSPVVVSNSDPPRVIDWVVTG